MNSSRASSLCRAGRCAALALVLSLGAARAAAPSGAASPDAEAPCPILGAIRWDAWFGSKGVPGEAVERSLGPERWHSRLPECADVLDARTVRIACDSAGQMGREIQQAADAGIGFWAFVTYPESDPMNRGLETYLAAPNRERIRFALLTELDKWGDGKSYRPSLERFARLLREPTYLRTAQGRPVLFLGFLSDAQIAQRFGSVEGLAAVLSEFRQHLVATGSPTPFIVLLESDVGRAERWMRALALDAISAYVVADNTAVAAPYARLVSKVESFWEAVQARDLPLVPLAMSGWDRRPRVLNPVPWEHGVYSEPQMHWYYEPPTSDELAAHVGAALQRARRTPRSGSVVLAYAWNEFDEGGWLAPTLGEGGARLGAIRKAIDRACARPPSATR